MPVFVGAQAFIIRADHLLSNTALVKNVPGWNAPRMSGVPYLNGFGHGVRKLCAFKKAFQTEAQKTDPNK